MKNCKSCGRSLSDDALFCPGCGGNDFAADQASGASQDVRFSFTPTEIKGKVKAWQIILITLGCIALIAAGIFAVKSVFSAKSYTSGEIIEGVYTNDWAELKYVIDDGFEDHTAQDTEFYDAEYTDVGLVAKHSDGVAGVSVLFMHIGNARGYSEQDGMNDYLDGYAEAFEAEYGIAPTVSQYFKYNIAENDYTVAKIDFGQYGIEYDCISFRGEYAVVITVNASDEEAVRSILSDFEYYEAE